MEISVRDNRLKAALQDESVCKRRYGSDMAKKLKNRLATLGAAASLRTFGRPNPDRNGAMSYRVIWRGRSRSI
jgi:plasmid maintenance system killer protein